MPFYSYLGGCKQGFPWHNSFHSESLAGKRPYSKGCKLTPAGSGLVMNELS